MLPRQALQPQILWSSPALQAALLPLKQPWHFLTPHCLSSHVHDRPHHATQPIVACFRLHATANSCWVSPPPTTAHAAFLLPSPLPLAIVTLPYTANAWSMSKRNMMNIVNMPTLLKEINDSRGEGAALIARLRGCGQDALHENWDILIFKKI